MSPPFNLISLLFLITTIFCSIQLYHLQLTQINTAYTLAFSNAFANTPNFAFYIETATFYGSQFSITYDSALTQVTTTNINISFIVLRQSEFKSTEIINLALLVTDQNPLQFCVGLVQVYLNNTSIISIPNVTISSTSEIEVYSLSYPLVWTKTTDLQKIYLSISKYSSLYASNVTFAYIYYTNIFVGQNVIALFQDITETIYDYFIPYQNFAFAPSSANVMQALKQYDSSAVPFMNSKLTIVYNGFAGTLNQLQIGYTFPNGQPVIFRSDVLVFNSSFSGCSEGSFLYYPVFFSTLPFNCIPCSSLCASCAPINATSTSLTNANSCLSCYYLRYLNNSLSLNGNCLCYTGLSEINGTCQPCEAGCLQFHVTYVESTTQSNFLLFYSMGNVNEQLQISNNLLVYVTGQSVPYSANQQEAAVYVISIDLSYIDPCSQNGCAVMFYYQFPNMVLTVDGSKSLSNNNVTVTISNIPDYYSLIPGELQQGFQILGLITAGSYMGGYSSLFKLLFELQQLIDAHKYLNLTIPIIFNQLLDNLFYFRFLDITNLIPWADQVSIQNVAPNDLDVYGQPRFMYYQNGLNFYKNTINAIITCCCILMINFIMFLILRILPFDFTHNLAQKMNVRKMVTVHDTLQNLELPVMIYAISQLQLILLHSHLIWIYCMTLLLSTVALAAPFLVVIYIYHHRHIKERIHIYEDLMQDNAMSQSITYIYYIFNFYRKIIIALALSPWLPGVVQIYVMLTVNFIHLFFQMYLIAVRAFNSKMKIIIRLIYSLCIITLELLILIYNISTYDPNTMINIGMACLYMSITTTLLGMADVTIKMIQLFCQQTKKNMKVSSQLQLPQPEMLKQFQLNIICKIGDDLASTKAVPFRAHGIDDKELVETTFHNKDQSFSECISVKIMDKTKLDVGSNDLVFIDEEWMGVYPPQKQKNTRLPKSKIQAKTKTINKAQFSSQTELYHITPQMQKHVNEMQKNSKTQTVVANQLKKTSKEIVQVSKKLQKSEQKQIQVGASKRVGSIKDRRSKVTQIKKQSKKQHILMMKDIKQISMQEIADQVVLH